MLKNLLIITFILSSTSAFCAEGDYSDFEAELKALETNQLRAEELQMNQADAVTDVITDEVGTGQAAIMRNADLSELTEPTPKQSPSKKEKVEDEVRPRRIRSR